MKKLAIVLLASLLLSGCAALDSFNKTDLPDGVKISIAGYPVIEMGLTNNVKNEE